MSYWGILEGTSREIRNHFCPRSWGQEIQATQWRKAVGIKLAQSILERSCTVGDMDKGSIKETEFAMSLDHWIKFEKAEMKEESKRVVVRASDTGLSFVL